MIGGHRIVSLYMYIIHASAVGVSFFGGQFDKAVGYDALRTSLTICIL